MIVLDSKQCEAIAALQRVLDEHFLMYPERTSITVANINIMVNSEESLYTYDSIGTVRWEDGRHVFQPAKE